MLIYSYTTSASIQAFEVICSNTFAALHNLQYGLVS